MPITVDPIGAITITVVGNREGAVIVKKPGASLRAFGIMTSGHEVSGAAYVHDLLPEDPFRAFSSVVTKYSSRSRWNFSCIALNLATRAAISARALAARSLCSVIAHPF